MGGKKSINTDATCNNREEGSVCRWGTGKKKDLRGPQGRGKGRGGVKRKRVVNRGGFGSSHPSPVRRDRPWRHEARKTTSHSGGERTNVVKIAWIFGFALGDDGEKKKGSTLKRFDSGKKKKAGLGKKTQRGGRRAKGVLQKKVNSGRLWRKRKQT